MNDDSDSADDLHWAAAAGDLDRVRQLLDAGYDLNAFDDLDYTPLHHAALKEHVAVVSLLLGKGADVNAHNEPRIGDTPLAVCAQTCSLEMASLLLEAGADPTIRGWMGLTALDRVRGRKRGDGPRVRDLMERFASKRT